MYLLSYHTNPNNPIASPPNMARRSNIAPPIDDLPAKTSLAAVDVDSQAWLNISIIKNTKIPITKEFRNPFCFGVRRCRKATGSPKNIVKPAIDPKSKSW